MSEPTKTDRPAPAAGERYMIEDVFGDRWNVFEADGTIIASILSLSDARLLVHGGRAVAALERADEIIQSTCSSDVVGKAWAEAADEWQVEVRAILAALRGTP